VYAIKTTAQFRRDLKTVEKRGYNIGLLTQVVKKIAAGETLDKRYNDHPLKGKYAGYRECHVSLDWLLIYKISDNTLILGLTRTGTHSDLF